MPQGEEGMQDQLIVEAIYAAANSGGAVELSLPRRPTSNWKSPPGDLNHTFADNTKGTTKTTLAVRCPSYGED
jgi:hypothetical protein